MKKILLILLSHWLLIQTNAQNIIRGEYYLNTEPGVGLGTPIVFDPADSLNVSFDVSTMGLEDGINHLYVRFQSENDHWGMTMCKMFYIMPAERYTNAANNTFSRAEYYIDTEPGVGNGIPLTFASSSDSLEQEFTFNLDALTPGFHHLYVRTLGDNGRWSMTFSKMFLVSQIPVADLSATVGEYFVDTEPGVGNGTPFNITTPSDSVAQDFIIDLPTLPLGDHIMYMRFKNAEGVWSMLEPRPFVVCESYASQSAFDFTTSDDLAFFYDQSEYADSVLWDFGDGNTTTAINPSHLYSNAGQFTVKQKTYNTCGNDSTFQFVDINGVNAMTPTFSANSNYILANISGAGFTANMQVKLIKDGDEILGENIISNESHSMTANFNFVEETLGLWDLVVIIDGSITDTLHDIFEMQAPTPLNLNTYIVSPPRILVNRNLNVLVNVTNESNQSVFGLQHFVKFPRAGTTVKLLTETKALSLASHLVDSLYNSMVVTLDPLTQDSIYSGHYIIPMLGPGQTATMMFSVNSSVSQRLNVQSNIGNSIFSPAQVQQLLAGNVNFTPSGLSMLAARSKQTAIASLQSNTNITNAIRSLVTSTVTGLPFNSPTTFPVNTSFPGVPNLISNNPPVGCSGCGNIGLPTNPGVTPPIPAPTEIGQVLFDPFLPEIPEDVWEFTEEDLANWEVDTDPATDVLDDNAEDVVDVVEEDTGEDVWEFTEEDLEEEPWEFTPEEICGGSCDPVGPIDDNEGDEDDTEIVPIVQSFDPNAIYGPEGFTTERYLPDNLRMDYRIAFENISTAEANAVEVFIKSSIDTNVFDIHSFRYEAFGFGEYLYALAPYRNDFTAELSLEGIQNCILRVTGKSPENNGMLDVTFQSLNLETRELINNPDDGFLPPNTDAPNGEGFIVFSVKQKDGIAHLTEMPMQASIIFDANEAIVTNLHNNIIDIEAPESSIAPIPALVENNMITLHFNKTDAHSGVRVVDVYGSINGGPFSVFTRTNSDSLQVMMEMGNTYSFFNVATDYCNNQEANDGIADVTTTYVTDIHDRNSSIALSVYPVPAHDNITMTMMLPTTSSVSYVLTDLNGRTTFRSEKWMKTSGYIQHPIDISGMAQGIYMLRVMVGEEMYMHKLVVQ